MVECLLGTNHLDMHLCRLENGTYILWELDACNCVEEDCECFVWIEIPLEEAEQLLRRRSLK
jgi:hypothetical protein